MSNPHPVPHWRPQIYWDRAWLIEEYTGKGRSAVAIARACDCTTNCIYFWLARHDIPRRTIADAAQLREARKRGADLLGTGEDTRHANG